MIFKATITLCVISFIAACSSGGNSSGTFTTSNTSSSSSGASNLFDLREGVYSTQVSMTGTIPGSGSINGQAYTKTSIGTRNSLNYATIFDNSDGTYGLHNCFLRLSDASREDILLPWLDRPYGQCQAPTSSWSSDDVIGGERVCEDPALRNGQLHFLSSAFVPPNFSVSLNYDGIELWRQGDTFCASASSYLGSEEYEYQGQTYLSESMSKTIIKVGDRFANDPVSLELVIFGLNASNSDSVNQYLAGEYESVISDDLLSIENIRYQPGRFVAYFYEGNIEHQFETGEIIATVSNGIIELLINGTSNWEGEISGTIYMDAPAVVTPPSN